MKEVGELKKMAVDALQDQLLDLRRQQLNMRLQRSNGTPPKPHLVRGIRKEIARIKTIMGQKERGEV